MPVLHYEVETDSHQKVVVTLRGGAASVLVVDHNNFRCYQAGDDFQYSGGYYETSPVIIELSVAYGS